MIHKLYTKYFQIFAMAKAQNHIICKMHSVWRPEPKTVISIYDMLTGKPYLEKEYIESPWAAEETFREVSDDLRKLVNRWGKITAKQWVRYLPYMDLYYKMYILRRKKSDWDIRILTQQYSAKQTTISLESRDDPDNVFAINIDEDQHDSMDEVVKVLNILIAESNKLDEIAEEDDAMDVVVQKEEDSEDWFTSNIVTDELNWRA